MDIDHRLIICYFDAGLIFVSFTREVPHVMVLDCDCGTVSLRGDQSY
jgi:hypothetical protein